MSRKTKKGDSETQTAASTSLKRRRVGQRASDNMRRGFGYLLVTGAVLFLLVYLIPEVFGMDISGIMKGAGALGLLRALMGIAIIAYALYGTWRFVGVCTLEGEPWHEGVRNAFGTPMFISNLITMVFMLGGGIALIVWGFQGMVP